jgi:hypothetical protein
MKTIGTSSWRIRVEEFKSLRIVPANKGTKYFPPQIYINQNFVCEDQDDGSALLGEMWAMEILTYDELQQHVKEWARVCKEAKGGGD